MAHFAQIDENGIVLRVIVVNNEDCKDAHGVEKEVYGELFCKTLFGAETKWVQTSYHGHIRKNFAGIGYKFDPALDGFVPPQPYPSWRLNEEKCLWAAPAPMPTDGKMYNWDEPTTSWVEMALERPDTPKVG